MLTGDWGTSIGTKQPVLADILSRLPATLELVVRGDADRHPARDPARPRRRPLAAQAAGLARRASSRSSRVSLPAFWLGLLLQILFFRTLDVLPLTGRVDADLVHLARSRRSPASTSWTAR